MSKWLEIAWWIITNLPTIYEFVKKIIDMMNTLSAEQKASYKTCFKKACKSKDFAAMARLQADLSKEAGPGT